MQNKKLFKSFLNFTISVHDITDGMRENVRPDNVTPLQYRILEFLFLENDYTISKLCSCLGISLPNTSREVKKLSQAGYIIKVSDPSDGRKSYLALSQHGTETMAQSFSALEENFNKRIGNLTPKEQEQLMENMGYIMEKLL